MLRRIAPLLSLPLLVGSCQDEVNTLFDEEGVWALIEFDITNEGLQPITDTRENGFLLWFMPEKKGEGIVAAATCVDVDGNDDPSNSFCRMDDQAHWECACFKYVFEEASMSWIEYEPGTEPPATVPPPGGSGGTDGGGSSTLITLAEREGVGSTYIFQPLPVGLFGATESSTFVFQEKAQSVWTSPPYMNPPMAPDCEMQCQ